MLFITEVERVKRCPRTTLPCFMACFSCRAGWIFSICLVRKSIFLLKKSLASSAVCKVTGKWRAKRRPYAAL